MFIKEITIMSFENYFSLWNDLNTAQKKLISVNLITQEVKKGTIIHNGNLDCTGLLLVKSGQLRLRQKRHGKVCTDGRSDHPVSYTHLSSTIQVSVVNDRSLFYLLCD